MSYPQGPFSQWIAMLDLEKLENELPLCPNCGRWFDGKSEAADCNHGPEYIKYGLTLRKIAACKSANRPRTALPLVEFNDHHERGYD